MSKILCNCGHVIIDQTDNLSYKANYIRNQDVEKEYKRFEAIKSFLVALRKGDRVSWIQNYFGQEYPINIDDTSIIHDILLRDEHNIYQCENCGRLLVQNWGDNSYSSFYPENENLRGLFIKNS